MSGLHGTRGYKSLTLHSDQIQQNVLAKQYFCDVDIAHLISYNEELAHELTANPTELIPLVSSLAIGY